MSCNVNTLLASGAAFQSLSERDQQIVIAEILCEISSSDASGGVKFGDPIGLTPISAGALAYDSLGNVWVDLDPSGAHNWKVVVSAEAPAPVMARAESLVIPVMGAPQSLALPGVHLPKPRNRLKEALNTMRMLLLTFFT